MERENEQDNLVPGGAAFATGHLVDLATSFVVSSASFGITHTDVWQT
jgi:hypothetical protein